MKKLLRWTGITLGILLLLLILGIILLPIVFPLEKIKGFAASKLSEALHREVKIEKVSFDIFSGIKLQGLHVGNRVGFARGPFVSADAIELRYAFWPLFSRQIIIKEICLAKPEILIEKKASGELNFSDLTQLKVKPTNENDKRKRYVADTDKRSAKPPFDLLIASFSIKDGKLTYRDYSARTTSEIRKLNFRLDGFGLALLKPIEAKFSAIASYRGKEVPFSLLAKIGVNLPQETITFNPISFSLAGESATVRGSLSGWKKAPQIDLSLSTDSLNVDPLLAIFAPTSKPDKPKIKAKPGELTKSIDKLAASLPRNIKAKLSLSAKNLSFLNFKLDRLLASASLIDKVAAVNLKDVSIYEGALSGQAQVNLKVPGLQYSIKDLRLRGFNAAPFSNAMVETFLIKLPDYRDLTNKVYGHLGASLNLAGRGVEPQDILANLAGNAELTLKDGELKRVKTLAAIGKTLKSNSLQEDIKFGLLTAAAGINRQVINVSNLKIDETDFKLHFKGGIDLTKLSWVAGNRLTLKLAPALTRGIGPEFSIFRDRQGWLEMVFEISGSLKLPLPKPILDKPMEAAIGKLKVKVEAKKVELEQQAKEEAGKVLEEQKGKLQEEAKKQLKNLIKF